MSRVAKSVVRGIGAAFLCLSLRSEAASTANNAFIHVQGGLFEPGLQWQELAELILQCAQTEGAERCRPERFSGELAVGNVRSVPPFELQRFEVSVKEYRWCESLGRCAARTLPAEQAELPVSSVSYDDALAYCRTIGARLPTELEFEYAARGPQRRLYATPKDLEALSVNAGQPGPLETDASDGFAERAPVDSFPDGRTPEGFHHLAGNVEEWTQPDAPIGAPLPKGRRPVMGGHFANSLVELRATARRLSSTRERTKVRGFRCAR